MVVTVWFTETIPVFPRQGSIYHAAVAKAKMHEEEHGQTLEEVVRGCVAAWRDATDHQYAWGKKAHLVHALLHLLASACEEASERRDARAALHWCQLAEQVLEHDSARLAAQVTGRRRRARARLRWTVQTSARKLNLAASPPLHTALRAPSMAGRKGWNQRLCRRDYANGSGDVRIRLYGTFSFVQTIPGCELDQRHWCEETRQTSGCCVRHQDSHAGPSPLISVVLRGYTTTAVGSGVLIDDDRANTRDVRFSLASFHEADRAPLGVAGPALPGAGHGFGGSMPVLVSPPPGRVANSARCARGLNLLRRIGPSPRKFTRTCIQADRSSAGKRSKKRANECQ